MEQKTYKTALTNFGYNVYEGPDPREAKAAAINAGFEAHILEDGKVIMSYSPIGGFRNGQI